MYIHYDCSGKFPEFLMGGYKRAYFETHFFFISLILNSDKLFVICNLRQQFGILNKSEFVHHYLFMEMTTSLLTDNGEQDKRICPEPLSSEDRSSDNSGQKSFPQQYVWHIVRCCIGCIQV